MASQVDVVIVGAGSAGLSAAKSAGSHGLSFVLLDASHRIGGRAHTVEFVPGQPVDRLFFAGEATSRDFSCTCHGAYLTGQRAIAEIAALSRRPDTTR